jgi:hypothetical protein
MTLPFSILKRLKFASARDALVMMNNIPKPTTYLIAILRAVLAMFRVPDPSPDQILVALSPIESPRIRTTGIPANFGISKPNVGADEINRRDDGGRGLIAEPRQRLERAGVRFD